MSKCLLFDYDGTLVDSERLCSLGIAIKFDDFGIKLDADELVKRFKGWKLATILDTLEQEYEIKLAEDFVPSYRALITNLFETDLKPIEGIEQALKVLPHPKAVVSSGPAHKIEQTLRVCGLTDYFTSNIYSSYEVKIWKPDPGIYQYAAKDMGYLPNDCIVIDDGPVGVEAGHKAGMKTLFFNVFQESCELSNVVSFSSMRELPLLIGM